ncbi:MAG TPA: hypothetical protein DEV93_14715 [Chloroflexi bacterium]|nr:hypothetical protein [Chloroflexota bacterium]
MPEVLTTQGEVLDRHSVMDSAYNWTALQGWRTPLTALQLVERTGRVPGTARSAPDQTRCRAADRGVCEFLHTAIENHAFEFPSDPAVVADGLCLSFGELDGRANRVAWELAEKGVGQATCVAVVMKKGWEQIVAVLAVLKVGAAYVPLDADLPPQRLRKIVELVQAPVALTQADASPELDLGLAVYCLTIDESAGGIPQPPAVKGATPENLAYIIFTSGSTGAPKGVMVTHAAVMTTIREINRRFGVSRGDRVLGLSSLSFDLSV